MSALVAWRMLTDEKARSALAVGGIFISVLMIFLQLGFYNCVPKGAMLTYNGFDILLTSSSRTIIGHVVKAMQLSGLGGHTNSSVSPPCAGAGAMNSGNVAATGPQDEQTPA